MIETLPIAVLALFLGALAVAALAPRDRRLASLIAALTMLVAIAAIAPHAPTAFAGGVVVEGGPWLPDWGLNLTFRLDGLGLLFAILILGIGLLIILYATYYLPESDGLVRFFTFLLSFAGGMLGVVLAENVILLAVLWEVTSITSFLLIAYKHQYHEGRIGARMALAVTGMGGLLLLAGLLLLGRVAGSHEVSVILARGDVIRADPLYPVILGLVLMGAFTKSAQFPFHFWLPNAMAAPTPVSAYLHSATMVKAGIFLLGRLSPALAGTDLWFVIVTTAGAVTFGYAAFVALTKDDLKGLLAYSTVSHLGLITMLFGLSTPGASVAAVFHIINHATFKAGLFMAAGIIDHETGTRDMRRLRGIGRLMPVTATLSIIAAASMAGMPLLNGFLSKEMMFEQVVLSERLGAVASPLLIGFVTLAGALSVAYALRFILDVFLRPGEADLPKTPHEPPRPMRLPVELLCLLVVAIGVLPQLVAGGLVQASAGAVLGTLPEVKLKIWHGFNLPLAMSAVAVLVGALVYTQCKRFTTFNQWFRETFESPVIFDRAYQRLERLSARIYRSLANGSFQRYALLLLAASLVLPGAAFFATGVTLARPATALLPVGVIDAVVFLAMLAALAAAVLWHQERLKAIIAVSVVGTAVTLAFVRFSAPDLALTQLSVEVVTIILLLLVLRFLPNRTADREPALRLWRDGALAALAGLSVAALTFAMLTRPFETIAGFHLANSYAGGGGTNVVNVILVDFRGFDTLGEICVLALAALGADALLRGLRLVPHAKAAGPAESREAVMFAMLMRPLLPLALVASFYIMLRGHNLPGGGFIAGLMTAVAILLQFMAGGATFVEERFRFDARRIFAWGIVCAAGVGLVSMALGYPFLTSSHGYVTLPLVGKQHLASALVFDLGVYLLVVGATVLLILSVAGLSRRELAPVSAADEPAAAVVRPEAAFADREAR